MTTRRDFLAHTAAWGTAPVLALLPPAQAQTLDAARIVCGFPPGGTSDALSLSVAARLRGSLASDVSVENRPGAGGQTAIVGVRDSPADGTTLLMTPSSMLSIYPYVYKSLPYSPQEDVKPVSVAAYFSHAFGVGPAVPQSVRTLKDFLAWCKANPDRATYGSPGAGSMPHLIVSLVGLLTNHEMRHVPYKGSAPGIQDLLNGQIAAMCSPVGDYLAHLASGRLRLLAISGTNRNPFVPDIPTFRQQGYPITVREWYGLFLPGKASQQVVQRTAALLKPALAHPELVTSMARLGLEAQSSSPEALADLLRADADEWRRLIKYINFTPES